MRDLTLNEIEQINGGAVPFLLWAAGTAGAAAAAYTIGYIERARAEAREAARRYRDFYNDPRRISA